MTPSTEPVTLESAGAPRLYQQADELRAAGPAVRVRLPGGVIAWSVTRGDVVRHLLTHPHVSKDARNSWPGYVPGAIPWLYSWVDVQSMFTSDADDHHRLKNLVGRAFTARRVASMRPRITTIVTELLDALADHRPGTVVDLRRTYTYRVPTQVICDLVGVPADQRPAMLHVIDQVLTTDVTPARAEQIRRDLLTAMRTLIDTKRHTPGEDMTSVLLTAHDGDRLSETELVSTLILMIGAGSETAVALLGHAIRELLAHPGQLTTLRADPARWPDAVEETLRLHPPIMHMPLRYATADIELGDGVTIRTGDAIIVGFGAHGRDPGTHANPAAFDLDREDKQHLVFGHGIHYCLGAPLARLEAELALPALFDRFPRLALAIRPGELQPHRSFIGNDITELPIRLSPAA